MWGGNEWTNAMFKKYKNAIMFMVVIFCLFYLVRYINLT